MRHDRDRAVGRRHVVQGTPTGEIGLVAIAGIAELHVAGVLVPSELHALFGPLDDPLLIEEVDGLAEEGRGNGTHRLPEHELRQVLAVAVAVADEIALAAVRDSEHVGAALGKPGVGSLDEHGALAAQHGEIRRVDDGFENDESSLREGRLLRLANRPGHLIRPFADPKLRTVAARGRPRTVEARPCHRAQRHLR